MGDVIVKKADPVQSAAPFFVPLNAPMGTVQSAAESDDAGQPVADRTPDGRIPAVAVASQTAA